jgi:hypothetical protein
MAITVEAVHRKVQYTSSGSAGPYAFSFKVLAATDVKVSVNDTLKTVSTHYTTAYSADGTGSVTFTSGNEPASGALVTIESDQAIARTTDYSTGAWADNFTNHRRGNFSFSSGDFSYSGGNFRHGGCIFSFRSGQFSRNRCGRNFNGRRNGLGCSTWLNMGGSIPEGVRHG